MFLMLPSEDDRLRSVGTTSGLYNFMITSFSSPVSTFNSLSQLFAAVSIRWATPVNFVPLIFSVSSTDFIKACKSISIGGFLTGIFNRLTILTALCIALLGRRLRVNSFTTTSESLSDSRNLKMNVVSPIFFCLVKSYRKTHIGSWWMLFMNESMIGSTKLHLKSVCREWGDLHWLSSRVGKTVNGTKDGSSFIILLTTGLYLSKGCFCVPTHFCSSIEEKSNLRYSGLRTAGNLRFGKNRATRGMFRKSIVCSEKVCFSSGSSNRCDFWCFLDFSFQEFSSTISMAANASWKWSNLFRN